MKKRPASSKPEPTRQRHIKVYVSEDEHQRIRIAAALLDLSLSDYCRAATVEDAERLTATIKLDATPRPKSN